MSDNKYRICWLKTKKNSCWQSQQEVIVFGEESAAHIMKNLEEDPAVNLINVYPVL
jgi:hypothetical protein